MKFTKMQGAGNDFVLIEAGNKNKDWSKLALAMCNRHYGVGADGLLVMMPSDSADFGMRVFNADGSEADICGNGLRCCVRYFLDTGPGNARVNEITVETMSGIRKAVPLPSESRWEHIRTFMGKPLLEVHKIPVIEKNRSFDIKNLPSCDIIISTGETLRLDLVSMGNPHAVQFIDTPVREYPLSTAGPEIATHGLFPDGVNFEVARVIDWDTIETRVWERGVGETLACGSGACAVTVVAYLRGYINNTVDIVLPGGVLNVEWDGMGEVLLSGPAESVFTGEWTDQGG
ncbi:MAG: diaminopimelate epimerase [Dehalococcoidales bacterium]|nr:diaminopimelate epimerase [Dehalococcoidales bacterium]